MCYGLQFCVFVGFVCLCVYVCVSCDFSFFFLLEFSLLPFGFLKRNRKKAWSWIDGEVKRIWETIEENYDENILHKKFYFQQKRKWCLFRSFAHFKIRVSVFLLLEYLSIIYVYIFVCMHIYIYYTYTHIYITY